MKEKALEFFKGIGTIILFILLSFIGNILLGNFYISDNIIISTLSQLGTYIIILLGLILLYHKRLLEDLKTFKKEYIKTALKYWLIGLGIMMICNILIQSITGDIAANESANRELLTNFPISNIITMVFIGPLIEEITFRASFKKAFTKWYTFSLVTAIIFASFHLLAGSSLSEILYIIPYGALGFFFAKAFYETDNIYTSFIAHMVHNGICVCLIMLVYSLGVL